MYIYPVPPGNLTSKSVIITNFNSLVQERMNYSDYQCSFIKIIGPFCLNYKFDFHLEGAKNSDWEASR